MPKVKKAAPETNLSDPQYYFNRELSWLEFNNRVLHEGVDTRTPLLERLKFIAIFSSNLDEYFMVRVAALKEQIGAQVSNLTPDGRSPQEQLDALIQRLRPMVVQQHDHFEQKLRPQLTAKGIHILNYKDLNEEQRSYLRSYFQEKIFPVLTPLAIDPSHPFPYISNLRLNLAVIVKNPDTGEKRLARVKVPNNLTRFLSFPRELHLNQNGGLSIWTGIPIEQVIAHHLEFLFPGMDIQEYHVFRITRDADLEVQEDEADDLMLAIEQELRKRRLGGSVVRIEVESSTPAAVRKVLIQEMGLESSDIYEVEGLLSLKDLMFFMTLPLPELKDPPCIPVIPPRLLRVSKLIDRNSSQRNQEDFFSVIRQGDLMLHHPYHSFTASVQQFITQAAHDPDVLAIKMTLYRTADDSPIIKALIAAAEREKQVTVLVELKARFDEENNILWARKLEKSGVHVVYGMVGLKTHTKVTLVVRQENNYLRRYVHIGTGNYNHKTAKLYTDLGILSCAEDVGADLTGLFNYLTGYSRQQFYKNLLVAPVNLRNRIVALIQREMEHCQNGNAGRIIAKMNALVDPQIIKTLYQASQVGVQIDLIVRGICCLRPGVQGVSENIRVISIIGRYLEHSRVFHFHNNGEEEIFIGSADWMGRNLDRRVEAVTSIKDPSLATNLKEMLGIMLADNRQAWELQADGSYIQRRPGSNEPEQNSQQIFMNMALKSTEIV
ncbi:polyphosphate kinase 1 [Lyngbya aestuarii]|uniref:polyphosphate kinase 1 n=1 Tax=Lyngbya aestuarii TaxID=118322 RepID=UPI00403DAE80